MDLSRFRRTKKAPASPASSPPAIVLPDSPSDKSMSPAKADPPPTRRESPPTPPPLLTIPMPMTPRSDSGSKSPFRRGFHPFRQTQKRARSPAQATFSLPATPVTGGPMSIVDSDKSLPMAGDQPGDNTTQGNPKPLTMPAFLNLSYQEIESKFLDLNWAERFRINEAMSNPSPRYRFARVFGPEIKNRDRYGNIQPWANNRVKLQVPEGKTDYINASPIVLQSPINPEGKPPHRYIAMQGPKAGTAEHVWRMVIEQLQSPAVIVMLTETHEGGVEKCYPYFPRMVDETWQVGENDEFGDGFRAEIKCVSVEEHANGAIEARQIMVHVEGREDMTVWHLLYRKWPDFGVPALGDLESFFELMRLSREKNATEDNPRIIHCSAGVGRSGTFIALEHLMREIDSGDIDKREPIAHPNPDIDNDDIIYKTVDALREQRKLMVQAEPQYHFLYHVLRQHWLEKHGLMEQDMQEPAAKRLEVTKPGEHRSASFSAAIQRR